MKQISGMDASSIQFQICVAPFDLSESEWEETEANDFVIKTELHLRFSYMNRIVVEARASH